MIPNVVVGRGRVQRLAELAQQLVVHRIALLGTVQHDVADRSAILGKDCAHELELLLFVVSWRECASFTCAGPAAPSAGWIFSRSCVKTLPHRAPRPVSTTRRAAQA